MGGVIQTESPAPGGPRKGCAGRPWVQREEQAGSGQFTFPLFEESEPGPEPCRGWWQAQAFPKVRSLGV